MSNLAGRAAELSVPFPCATARLACAQSPRPERSGVAASPRWVVLLLPCVLGQTQAKTPVGARSGAARSQTSDRPNQPGSTASDLPAGASVERGADQRPARADAPSARPDQVSPADVPSEGWLRFLREKKPPASELARRLLRLHNQGRHEDVIRGIRAALIAGYSEPWMYEVLALSLEIAGHPQEEVERALTSRVDLATLDAPTILLTAAYLARFGLTERALELYRQAARVAPARPEPYALGLKLAEQAHDVDSIQWAATGIVQHVWTPDYPKWHQMAQVAVEQAAAELKQKGRADRARALLAAFRRANRCDLKLQLKWVGNADLDLEVEEPWGEVCSVQSPRTSGGGVFVKDGYGPDPEKSVEEYVCPVAVPGAYRVHIKWLGGDVVGKRCVLTVVRYQGTERESTLTHAVLLDSTDKVVRVSLKHGRRTEPLAVGWPIPLRKRPGPARPARTGTRLVQRLGVSTPEQRQAARRFFQAHPARKPRRASAVGYSPVISILSEGASATALAVVAGDRRYVRISIAPVFSTLVDVATFSFVRSGGSAASPAGQPAGALRAGPAAPGRRSP